MIIMVPPPHAPRAARAKHLIRVSETALYTGLTAAVCVCMCVCVRLPGTLFLNPSDETIKLLLHTPFSFSLLVLMFFFTWVFAVGLTLMRVMKVRRVIERERERRERGERQRRERETIKRETKSGALCPCRCVFTFSS
jgi:hypothetical protein